MVEQKKDICISQDLFSDLIVQVGTLKEIQDRIKEDKRISVYQKNVLLKNKVKTTEILKQLEIICENL